MRMMASVSATVTDKPATACGAVAAAQAPLRRRLALVVAALTLCAGCSRELDGYYGRSGGMIGGESVNGTAVLKEMFAEYGHSTNAWYRLSPRLHNKVDVIVWFPSDHGVPSQDACDWLYDWLDADVDRTLIYVGRDFDATPDYWRKMKQGAPPEQTPEINRLLNEAQAAAQANRAALAPSECDWFRLQSDRPRRDVRTLTGDSAWIDGVDATKVEISLDARLVPLENLDYADEPPELLLASEGDALVSRQPLGGGQLILVANGSFLLNMPLVNREHRKLAGSLIEEVGDDRYVMFLETTHAPEILDTEPELSLPTGLELLGIYPFGTILLHAMLLGVLYCFWRLPIFGLPRGVERESTGDFGQHVTALGSLLNKAADEGHARTRLAHVHRILHPEAALPAEAPGRPAMSAPPPQAAEPTPSPEPTASNSAAENAPPDPAATNPEASPSDSP